MINYNTPLSYDLDKTYRNEQEQRAIREQQANAVRNDKDSKKGISLTQVINQIIVMVK